MEKNGAVRSDTVFSVRPSADTHTEAGNEMRNVNWSSITSYSPVWAVASLFLAMLSACSLTPPKQSVIFSIDTRELAYAYESSEKGVAPSETAHVGPGGASVPLTSPSQFFPPYNNPSNGFSCLGILISLKGAIIEEPLPNGFKFTEIHRSKVFPKERRLIKLASLRDSVIEAPFMLPGPGTYTVQVWGVQSSDGSCPSEGNSENGTSPKPEFEVYSLIDQSVAVHGATVSSFSLSSDTSSLNKVFDRIKVEITQAPATITSNNPFTLSGTCTERGKDVRVMMMNMQNSQWIATAQCDATGHWTAGQLNLPLCSGQNICLEARHGDFSLAPGAVSANSQTITITNATISQSCPTNSGGSTGGTGPQYTPCTNCVYWNGLKLVDHSGQDRSLTAESELHINSSWPNPYKWTANGSPVLSKIVITTGGSLDLLEGASMIARSIAITGGSLKLAQGSTLELTKGGLTAYSSGTVPSKIIVDRGATLLISNGNVTFGQNSHSLLNGQLVLNSTGQQSLKSESSPGSGMNGEGLVLLKGGQKEVTGNLPAKLEVEAPATLTGITTIDFLQFPENQYQLSVMNQNQLTVRDLGSLILTDNAVLRVPGSLSLPTMATGVALNSNSKIVLLGHRFRSFTQGQTVTPKINDTGFDGAIASLVKTDAGSSVIYSAESLNLSPLDSCQIYLRGTWNGSTCYGQRKEHQEDCTSQGRTWKGDTFAGYCTQSGSISNN
jgi:hypothetical protein